MGGKRRKSSCIVAGCQKTVYAYKGQSRKCGGPHDNNNDENRGPPPSSNKRQRPTTDLSNNCFKRSFNRWPKRPKPSRDTMVSRCPQCKSLFVNAPVATVGDLDIVWKGLQARDDFKTSAAIFFEHAWADPPQSVAELTAAIHAAVPKQRQTTLKSMLKDLGGKSAEQGAILGYRRICTPASFAAYAKTVPFIDFFFPRVREAGRATAGFSGHGLGRENPYEHSLDKQEHILDCQLGILYQTKDSGVHADSIIRSFSRPSSHERSYFTDAVGLSMKEMHVGIIPPDR